MEHVIVTTARTKAIGNGLSYASDQELRPGQLVRVPLRNKSVEGIALEPAKALQEAVSVKQIEALVGTSPLLSPAQIATVRWMADYYCCTLRQALSVWLPPPPWRLLLPKPQTHWRALRPDTQVRGSKQQMVLDTLSGRVVPESELREQTGASLATLRSLEKKGYIESYDVESTPSAIHGNSADSMPLSPEQRACVDAIEAETRPSLLFGVTGSGKTHVYSTLIANTIQKGKQVILLAPEILLSEFTWQRFENLLPKGAVAILHSKLTAAQRRSIWQRVRSGQVRLIIGSRSALFAPAHQLGLVIVDEEHEWTYKNEQTPRYHTRETAEALCKHAGATLVLGSATPSLESWQRTKDGRYALHRLEDRHGGHSMPKVRVVDLATAEFGPHYPFTPPVIEGIADRLKKGEQVILFLNRRGAASALLCLDCRRRVVSPESQLPFTVHSGQRGSLYLEDHTTGLRADVPSTCPSCSSVRLHAIGAGTQRIEALCQTLFPKARLLRADADTLSHPEEMRTMLDRMQSGEADILLGTQIVAKGLDLPKVTLAIVLLADIGLSLPHFRAGERVFQLLTQLTGRSGRKAPGEVLIQTFRPTAPEIRLAAEHNTEAFLEQELKLRTHTKYPPVSRMVRLIVRGPGAAEQARRVAKEVRQCPQQTPFSVGAAPTMFGGGREWHVLLRGENPKKILAQINLDEVIVDIDPLECV